MSIKKRELIFLVVFIVFISLFGCKHKRPEPGFYKNLYTEEVFGKAEFLELMNSLRVNYADSTKRKVNLKIHFYRLLYSGDSIIQPFKYSIKIGNEYIVRADSFEKIGMRISPRVFQTINGDSIQIGGAQDKPVFINLWFVECPGCIAEMPALNQLEEKYRDKVDFVAMTFESEQAVLKFLKKREFNFKHVVNAEGFIKEIGTKPYPENIIIDKNGCIKYIEGGLDNHEIKYFESILENLLNNE